MKRTLQLLVVGVVLLGLWFALRNIAPHTKDAPTPPEAAPNTEAAARIQVVPSEQPPDARLNRLPEGKVEFLPALEISRRIHESDTVEDGLREIEALLAQYRFAFGENPIGVENFEITEQLLGKNPKKVVFIARDSPALRGNELVDPWGTPYFFHPQSGTEMEIGSAGPDQILWTSDDVFILKR
ncbi:MAG: type II secretion system protein GspG [Pseudomonadota bacterium]